MDLRKRGARKERALPKGRIDPLSVDGNAPGAIGISSESMAALAHLYQVSPSIQAARTVLCGQLLSSGVVVRRAGRDVNLKDTFQRHLESVWIPFARNVIDSFLQFGMCLVSLEEEPPAPFANFLKGREAAGASDMGVSDNGRTKRSRPPDAAQSRAQKRPIDQDSRADARLVAHKQSSTVNLVPHVPDLGTYQLSFVRSGELSYRREYIVSAVGSDAVYRRDYSSELFIKSPPDHSGNICSPTATCFQSASFVAALEELALQAEVVRARQLLVTQPVQRTAHNNNLDPANLFFDSESRAVQASAAAEDDAAQAGSLAMQARLMATINRMQTTNDVSGGAGGGGAATAIPTHVPPALPPTLFAAPERQSVVPGVRPPEARSDLVDIIRVVNDHVAAAFGVPASIIFEGKFSSNSMSQWAHADPNPNPNPNPNRQRPDVALRVSADAALPRPSRQAAAAQHHGGEPRRCCESRVDRVVPRGLSRLQRGRRPRASNRSTRVDRGSRGAVHRRCD